MSNLLKSYFSLTKPGIILGNAITAAAGFALASKHILDSRLFFILFGISLVIASACVFNNYIDREADRKMARTQNRALATESISIRSAFIFALVLGFSGFLLLFLTSNLITVGLACVGFFVYVFVYSFLKYRTSYGTLIGSVSGAMPPMIAYCAVGNGIDGGALLLFLIMVLWQMPHFYAIALMRKEEYAAASIPVLSIQKEAHIVKKRMLFYIIAFMVPVFLLTLFGYTGFLFLFVASAVCFIWFLLCLNGFKIKNDLLWARKMFQFSLVVIMALSFMIFLDVR